MPVGEAPAGEASASHGTTSPAPAPATPIPSERLSISASSAIRLSPLTHSRHLGDRRQYARISRDCVIYAVQADWRLLPSAGCGKRLGGVTPPAPCGAPAATEG